MASFDGRYTYFESYDEVFTLSRYYILRNSGDYMLNYLLQGFQVPRPQIVNLYFNVILQKSQVVNSVESEAMGQQLVR